MPRGDPLPVLWHPSARGDLLDIVGYIAVRNPDAAQHLKDRIVSRSRSLGRHPLACRAGRIAGTREMVVQPNYIVVYSVAADHVMVLAVMHARRDWA